MNIRTGDQNIELGEAERRFVESERRLFDECGVTVSRSFLYAGDPAKRISVLETGAGRPLVMIHGGNSVAALWAPLWRHLDGYRVVAPDRPGCGLSHRQDYRGVAFRKHAVDFVKTVMDGARIERATLVGNSMGGFWSLVFALAHPERVESLILVGEPAGSAARPSGRHRLGAVPGLNRLIFATVARPRPDARIFRGLMADPGRASRSVIDCAFAGSQLPGAALAWRTMPERVARARPIELTHSLTAELESLQVPVLFAWGDRDFCPVDAGRAVAAHVPDARFELLPSAGHLAWLDQPEAVANLVTAFAPARPMVSQRTG